MDFYIIIMIVLNKKYKMEVTLTLHLRGDQNIPQ